MVSQKYWFRLIFVGFVLVTLLLMACRTISVQPGAPVRPEIASEANVEEAFVVEEAAIEMAVDVWPVLSEQHEASGLDYAYLEPPFDAGPTVDFSTVLRRPEVLPYLGPAPALPSLKGASVMEDRIEAGAAVEVAAPLSSLSDNVLYWRLYVDGQMVDFSSTNTIEFSASWLESLSPGEHDIQVEFLDDEYAPVWNVSPALTMNLVSAGDLAASEE